MGGPHLSVESAPAQPEVSLLERGLFAFEEARLGSPEHQHFAVFLRDPAGSVQGGVDGHVMWRRLFIKTLWLPDVLRGRGWGTALMRAAEAEARLRGCRSVWLTALGDRARHFYLRLDYRVFGMIEDYVPGQSLYSMDKSLD